MLNEKVLQNKKNNENVVVEDSTESFINDKTKKNLEIETSNYNFASPNNPLYDLIERQAKEFEEFGKRMSLDLQNFYKEYLNRQKGMNKVKNGYNEIEKVCKEFEEKIILQSQLIESLKARIEELETDSIVKDQDIKILRNEFNESVKTLSEQDNEKYQRRDSLTDQFSEILNLESFNDSINEINGDGAIFLHETIETRSGSIILRCKECGKNFRNHVRFMYHAKEKHQYKWLCLVCYQVFLSGRDRGIHMRKNHKKDYSCTLCTKACYDITGLREHFRAKHPGSTFPPTQPSIPSQPSILSRSSFPLRLQPFVPLTSHAKSKHGYKLLCIYCCQLFHQKAPRNKHMKEDHIHKCQTCDKEFRNGDGLISHCKAKKHNVEEAIHSVYSKLREYHSAQEENLQDLNIENIIESANGNNESYVI
ncbi:10808_t:CDS:2 [Rhizophagus irregularis]|nr:10808_t:CDS:2 [Rhizophagus irregularis]